MQFWKKICKNKKYIISVFIICLLSGILYSFKFTQKEYLTTSTIMLVKNNEGKVAESLELSDGLQSIVKEVIKSDLSIEKVKNNLNLNCENNELNKKIEVSKAKDSVAFKINVKDFNSKIALDVNKEIINVFSNRIKEMYTEKNVEIYIVDPAHIVNNHYSTQLIIPVVVAIVIGIVVNFVYILVLIKYENKVKNNSEIEADLILKSLVKLPKLKYKSNELKQELVVASCEKSEVINSFNKLRTNIQFLGVNNEILKRVILVTSPNSGDGKTFVAANLAIAFSQIGKKVVLIDADMENGRLGKLFNIPENLGFSNYLSNLDTSGAEINEFLNKFITETEIKNLSIITSGTVPPNSSELLTSEKLPNLIKDLKVFYDVVIIDSVSALLSTDALILSRMVGSTIIVSDSKKTKFEDLIKTKKDIQNVGGKILGVVLNRAKIRKNQKTIETRKKELQKLKNKIYKAIQKIVKKENHKQKLLTEGVNNKRDVIKPTNIPKHKKEEPTIKERINQLKFVKLIKDAYQEKRVNKKENVQNAKKTEIKEGKQTKQVKEEKNNKKIENKLEEGTKNKEKQEELENVLAEKKEKISTLEIAKEKASNVVKNSKIIIKENAKKIKENSTNIIGNVKNTYQEKISNLKGKNIISEKNKTTNEGDKVLKQNIIENSKQEIVEENPDSDNDVLVIVDAENAYCRVFSKKCFTEKSVRSSNLKNVFEDAHYSRKILKKRVNSLIETYGITKKQSERIDTLIYVTLMDYDAYIWYEYKEASNKAESYVMCMAKEYEKVFGEKNKDYIARCKRLRKAELKKAELDIEYKLENLWKTTKTKLSDKLAIKKFANLYEIDTRLKSDKEIMKSNEKKKVYSDIIKESDKNGEQESYSNSNIDFEEDELEREIREEEELLKKEQESYRLEQEKIKQEKKEEKERLRIERKIEQERIKNERREQKEKQRQEKQEENFRRREEKLKQKEELRKQKELEKEKQREEAKIEEELLVDNLYPKTKYNKDL